jgi:S-adenosylmethionine decarboxylase
MKNLSPTIYRKRIVIELVPGVLVNTKKVDVYLKKLSKLLKMRLVRGPMTRKNPRYGISSYIYWEESGTHFYFWEKPFPFLSVDIYTCKKFVNKAAVDFTKKYFKAKKSEWKEVKI